MVPGNQPRKIERARDSSSDVVVLDLEDSVPFEDKPKARHLVAESLLVDWTQPMFVRFNSTPDELARDVDFFRARPPAICLPKAERETVGLLANAEAALVETAAGVASVEEIAASPRLRLILVGLVDLAVSLRVAEVRDRGALAAARARIHLAARAAGVNVVDGGYASFRDSAGFEKICRLSKEFGFDGIICVHPTQVEIANHAFRSNADEIRWAEGVLEAWSKRERGIGVAIFNDSIVDGVHVRMANAILERR